MEQQQPVDRGSAAQQIASNYTRTAIANTHNLMITAAITPQVLEAESLPTLYKLLEGALAAVGSLLPRPEKENIDAEIGHE